MTKSTGFIDFTDFDNHDPDAWRGEVEKGMPRPRPQGSPCHMSHPDIKIGHGTLVGGNCRDHKRHENVRLYVALDSSQQHPTFTKKGEWSACVYYPIKNMSVPENPAKFHDLIDMIIEFLGNGHKVHVGCIGGHGRTGLVIAAVVAKMGIAHDAIGWTRKHYCARAIETRSQENFLVAHFGAKLPPEDQRVDKRRR